MPRRPPPSSFRLFVAIYPPPEIAADLLKLIPPLGLPPHRITPTDQLHMTLQFIGDTRRKHLNDVFESVRRSASGLTGFVLTVKRIVTLPRDGNQIPRLVAALTDEPSQVMELHRRLAQRLARNIRQKAGDRFTPHLTLCRFLSDEKSNPHVDTPIAVPASFTVSDITVMSSTLQHSGPRHSEMLRVPLIPR